MKTNSALCRLLYVGTFLLWVFPALLPAQQNTQNTKRREKPPKQEMYQGFSDAELEIETDKIREKRRRSVRTLVTGLQVFAGGVVTLIVAALTSDPGDQLNKDISTVMYVVSGITMGVGGGMTIGGGVGIGINNNKLKAIEEEKRRRAAGAAAQNSKRTPGLSFVLSPVFVGVNLSL